MAAGEEAGAGSAEVEAEADGAGVASLADAEGDTDALLSSPDPPQPASAAPERASKAVRASALRDGADFLLEETGAEVIMPSPFPPGGGASIRPARRGGMTQNRYGQ